MTPASLPCVPLCHLFDTSKRWHGNTCVGQPDNEEPWSNKAKKKETGTSECLSLSCLLIDDKENDGEVLDWGAGGDRQREFHLLSRIFRKETWAGILASHFSYCITLIKGLPGRFIWTDCHRDVLQAKSKNNNQKTPPSIVQRRLFPDSGINCLVLNDHGHCITWKLTARIYVSASLLASCRGWVAENK